jgi:cytochrome c553
MLRTISSSAVLTLCALSTVAFAADPAAGKAKVQQVCAECHDLTDWKGKSEKEMHDKIAGVVAGKTKHPTKLQLSDADIDNIAAYIGSGAK